MGIRIGEQQNVTLGQPRTLFTMSRFAREFEDVSHIGSGAFGRVFKATNKLDGCTYAVKSVRLRYSTRRLKYVAAALCRAALCCAVLRCAACFYPAQLMLSSG